MVSLCLVPEQNLLSHFYTESQRADSPRIRDNFTRDVKIREVRQVSSLKCRDDSENEDVQLRNENH